MMLDQEKTGLGNYFIANYPPFSFWKPEHVATALEVLGSPPAAGTPLGLYLHIPFCRKRCKFCYFRVYTDKNARDVETYLTALEREVELYSRQAAIRGRPLEFVYFGGGTPSYLSATQLSNLARSLQSLLPWDKAQEITFECEPGTLQQPKLAALREIGITRLSLGVENFDDRILEENGRAHRSAEIFRAYRWAQDLDFDQINIDLIAGMVGETDANWRDCIRKTIDLSPDSVTIYQMELPFNTVFSKELPVVESNGGVRGVADWPTKRAWVDLAFNELAKAGYEVTSTCTAVKDPQRTRFRYREGLFQGDDIIGTGVASFGHISGVHVQNVDQWQDYITRLEAGELPLHRALPLRPIDRLIREMILQLKIGRLDVAAFRRKHDQDIIVTFREPFEALRREGFLTYTPNEVTLTRTGLLQVDRLLPRFFLAEHRGARYT